MKPIRAITLRPGGTCGCTQCVADEQTDQARRDALLVAAIYTLGVDHLRRAALERAPSVIDSWRIAS